MTCRRVPCDASTLRHASWCASQTYSFPCVCVVLKFQSTQTATNMQSILRHGYVYVCVLAAVSQCAILSKLMPNENDSPYYHVSNSHKTLHSHTRRHPLGKIGSEKARHKLRMLRSVGSYYGFSYTFNAFHSVLLTAC